MQLSTYTSIIKDKVDNKDAYIFNISNLKWIKLDNRLAEELVRVHKMKHAENMMYVHEELYEVLLNEKFIVESTKDDCELYCHKYLDSRRNHEHVTITINPTMDCNIRCWYCYENHIHNSKMTKTVMNSLLRYIDRVLSSHTCKYLTLSFFGGEPLLQFQNCIVPIVIASKNLCKNRNVHLDLCITSNGVCINDQIINQLNDFDLPVKFQIAIDGGKEFHDKIKFLKNSTAHVGTYDLVLGNIRKLNNAKIRVTVRCNYDTNTIMSFLQVVDKMHAFCHPELLNFYFNKIWQESDTKELDAKLKQFKKSSFLKKVNHNLQNKGSAENFLTPCYADFNQNIIVNFNGDIFKCTARKFECNNKIGTLNSDGTILYNKKNFQLRDSILLQLCKSCKLLPICPVCIQRKFETPTDCPISINDEQINSNILNLFSSISGLNFYNLCIINI